MSVVTFGFDLPDRLILGNMMWTNFLQSFYKRTRDKYNVAWFVFNEDYDNLIKRHELGNYIKKDDYTLEFTLLHFKNYYRIKLHPIYILKNKKWYCCNTDFLLIPCEGEYSDLNRIKKDL